MPVDRSNSGRTLHVLVGVDLEAFRKLGGDDPASPRQPLAFPFYGGLRERGWKIELHRVISEGKGRAASAVVQGLGLRTLRALDDPVLALGMSGGELLLLASGGAKAPSRGILVQTAESGHLRGAKRALRDLLVRRALRRAGLVLFQVRECAEREAVRLKLDAAAVSVWTPGVDTRFFSPSPAFGDAAVRPELRRLSERPFAVVVGDQQRDESMLAEIFAGSGLPLVRVTQEPRVEAYWEAERRTRKGLPSVFCKAGLEASEMRHLYQHALCSLNLVDNSWQPAGVTVAMESMACGTPLIMNQGIATRDLARHGRPEDPPPFIEVESPVRPAGVRNLLAELLKDSTRCSALATAGRAYVERHLTIEKSVERLDELLRSRWQRAPSCR